MGEGTAIGLAVAQVIRFNIAALQHAELSHLNIQCRAARHDIELVCRVMYQPGPVTRPEYNIDEGGGKSRAASLLRNWLGRR